MGPRHHHSLVELFQLFQPVLYRVKIRSMGPRHHHSLVELFQLVLYRVKRHHHSLVELFQLFLYRVKIISMGPRHHHSLVELFQLVLYRVKIRIMAPSIFFIENLYFIFNSYLDWIHIVRRYCQFSRFKNVNHMFCCNVKP